MIAHPLPEQNHLLNALSDEVRACVFPELELVRLELGKSLYESGDAMHHVYFPVDSIISLLYVMEDGASAEISVVGNEGLVGVALFMGGESVTDAAGKLQKLGVIEYSRGHIIVLDRAHLERLSCECYAVVKRETDRLLPYLPRATGA